MESSPEISSFVIRIIQDGSPDTLFPFRGNIRHVQSDREISFTELSSVMDFINELLPVNKILQEDQVDTE